MLKLLQNLLTWNGALSVKYRSIKTYNDGLASYAAKEYKAAFPLLLESAELGNTMAMSVLGTAYLFGHGCSENGKAAERWLKQAVDAGYAEATGVLGMAYATGKAGCRRDLTLALPLLQSAAAQGDTQSADMLGMIERGEGMFARTKRRGGSGGRS